MLTTQGELLWDEMLDLVMSNYPGANILFWCCDELSVVDEFLPRLQHVGEKSHHPFRVKAVKPQSVAEVEALDADNLAPAPLWLDLTSGAPRLGNSAAQDAWWRACGDLMIRLNRSRGRWQEQAAGLLVLVLPTPWRDELRFAVPDLWAISIALLHTEQSLWAQPEDKGVLAMQASLWPAHPVQQEPSPQASWQVDKVLAAPPDSITINNLEDFLIARRDLVDEAAIAAWKADLERILERHPKVMQALQRQMLLAQLDQPARSLLEMPQRIQWATAALDLVQREQEPMLWATLNNELAMAYAQSPQGDRRQNLEAAIRHFQDALTVYTRENFPQDWAMTQNNLAAAYSDRIQGSRADNLEAAIRHYQAALEIRTRDAFPEDWAATQNNLAAAYRNRIQGSRSDKT